jgi:hypothetical protein
MSGTVTVHKELFLSADGSYEYREVAAARRVRASRDVAPLELTSGRYLAAIFAQESRNVTVRLNTGRPGAESGSAMKYPVRSNW